MQRADEFETKGPFEVKRRKELVPVSNTTRFSRTRRQPDEDLSVQSAEPPWRRYECAHYETCLDLAAALNWMSFTCTRCCGRVNESLYWRAHQIRRKDAVAKALCELPPLVAVDGLGCPVDATPVAPNDES